MVNGFFIIKPTKNDYDFMFRHGTAASWTKKGHSFFSFGEVIKNATGYGAAFIAGVGEVVLYDMDNVCEIKINNTEYHIVKPENIILKTLKYL